jgi:FkbM family methyltransferase
MKNTNKRKRFRVKRIIQDIKIILKNNNRLSRVFLYIFYVLLYRDKRFRVIVDGECVLIRCNTPDLKTAHRCLTTEFSSVIKLTNQKHELIIDAGGHIGSAAIAFARAFPESLVVCVEPHPENYEIACVNAEPYPNIVVLNAALTAKPGTVGLFDRGTGNWGYTILDNPADVEEPKDVAPVACVTVEQIIHEHKKRGIDIMKLDIEGAEREVLENSASWISRCELLFVELHDRIIPGCMRAYVNATEGRVDVPSRGEKLISLRQRMPSKPALAEGGKNAAIFPR